MTLTLWRGLFLIVVQVLGGTQKQLGFGSRLFFNNPQNFN